MGEPAEEARTAGFFWQPGGRRRPDSLYAQRLHQLPYDCGYCGDRPVRTRSDAFGEPRYDRVGAYRKYSGEPPEVDRRSQYDEARFANACNAFERSRP